ncbi:GntR family transcriptional regulator [Shimia sp. SDUM112013]|uniref:GntR family transcriptional regulator n=1 Tax=Shimia sp. SDUM112013 TaxID=3136160 RepID=UPI0032EFFF05
MTGAEKAMLSSANDTENATRIPAHQQVYLMLREQVLFGELTPGQPVTIQGLVEQLEAGMTPVREAIRRLTAEGALEFQGNRRVTVPTPSSKDIEELMYARKAIEPELVMRATRQISPSEIDELEQIDNRLDAAISNGDVETYLRQNYAFHAKLYTIADAPILTAIADGLWLRFGPSLRVVCGRLGTQNLPDQHKETLDALRQGDAEKAANAILDDVVQGMEQVRDSL